MGKQPNILLVEDNPTDVWAIQLAVEQAGIEADVKILTDGEQAISFIQNQLRPTPDLVILDLNLPRRSGHEILKQCRSGPLSRIPVLVVTSSDSPKDLEKAGAFTPHYFRKPLDLDEYLKLGEVVRSFLSGRAANA